MSGDADTTGKVGYRKPPAEHRFAKGKSGNPNGRPRKAKAQQQNRHQTVSLDFGSQPANALLMEEAYRPVTIREGEQIIKLPAIQAVFRSMGVAAMRGNRFAQRTMAELVNKVEEEDRQTRMEFFKAGVEYKTNWEDNIEWARNNGVPEPEPLPHPYDIVIDVKTATVHYNGPVTTEDKIAWDKNLARRDAAQAEVTYYATRHRSARDPKRKQMFLDDWHHEQRIFDLINDNLPRRYRTKLENRSWAKEATRERSQKARTWPGE
jgi:hypothetical protein